MAAPAVAAVSALPPAVVVHSDLPSELEAFCVEKGREALATHRVEKDQAAHLKRALEANNGGLWHVVIGSSFGMSVSHENNALLLFRIGKAHILAFQTFDDTSLVRKDGATHVHRKVEKKADDDDEGEA